MEKAPVQHYICVHGHFYQPPRENPWLEAIELQDSAFPHQNWNDRITAECYAPNTSSRIVDAQNYIVDIVNNFTKISFNFGPTLLSWMESAQPDVYQAILEADRLSLEQFSGHGAAMAQCYNHMIMPLANERDKRTQVFWGIRDFESRFNRKPEGMWLPETAVDTATLEVLAEFGIRFTVLAPQQMKSVRRLGDKVWKKAGDPAPDIFRPYRCSLPSGKSINIFFYEGNVAHDVAFGGLLNNGENFARRLTGIFSDKPGEPLLMHIATDGETYGHHHQFGNMALSYCLRSIESLPSVQLTVYGEYLDKYPPEYEVEIVENSSWSCSHGVERWRADCGCKIGDRSSWQQKWRAPLRKAMDYLRDQLSLVYEKEMGRYVKDPWQVRDQYIQVLLSRSSESVDAFLKRQVYVDLSAGDRVKILKLLELQKYAMYMYTSCGWFFDDVAGLEASQIIQYAGRAIQLAREISQKDFETQFVALLEKAPGNTPERKNGAEVFQKNVRPLMVDLMDVGAHYAISSLFEDYPDPAKVYAFTVHTLSTYQYETGKQRLLIGQARIRSDITLEEAEVDFTALHLGDYNLYCGVKPRGKDKDFDQFHDRIRQIFLQNNIPAVIQAMNENFGEHNYSLWDLFKNEQGKVLGEVFNNTLGSIESHFREIYEHYYPLMQIKPEFRIPLPKALSMTVEFILSREMVETLEDAHLDLENLEKVTTEIKRWSFMRDMESVSLTASRRIGALMQAIADEPQNNKHLKLLVGVLQALLPLSLPLELWRAQNIYFRMNRDIYKTMVSRARNTDAHAVEWVQLFESLGKYLKVRHG